MPVYRRAEDSLSLLKEVATPGHPESRRQYDCLNVLGVAACKGDYAILVPDTDIWIGDPEGVLINARDCLLMLLYSMKVTVHQGEVVKKPVLLVPLDECGRAVEALSNLPEYCFFDDKAALYARQGNRYCRIGALQAGNADAGLTHDVSQEVQKILAIRSEFREKQARSL